MLTETIRKNFMNARKVGDTDTKNALEAIVADILKREKSQVGHVVTDAEVIDGITKEIKVQNEIIGFATGRDEAKVNEAKKKIEILSAYLPKQLTEEEVVELIKKADVYTDNSPKTKGMIIKTVMPEIAGKFDKAKVNGLVEKYLNEKYSA
ncbi:MAG: GatB/YqeY domain-containing protein [Clostridia bacterium]|nr:GatB/YqeY domain-containing protein [Clostridia bacterium]